MRYPYIFPFISIFLLLFFPLNIYSKNNEDQRQEGNIPQPIEEVLTTLLNATSPNAKLPSPTELDTILNFILMPTQQIEKIQLATRDYGKGIFYNSTIHVPLHTLIQYMLNPNVPGETIYPTSIRRNAWVEGSEILTKYKNFLNTPFPPQKTLFSKGLEYEEITPDVSSGCYYNYLLNRLFVLYNFNNKTVLFSIAFMPETSSVGLRGAVVGPDNQWIYVYTPTVGTNLPLLSWAKTYMYGSATISIYAQNSKNNSTDVYIFKWTKAGWSGMNVVTHKHITDGVSRFISGLKQVIEHPNRPSVEKIAQKYNELNMLPLTELQDALKPFAEELTSLSNKYKTLSGKIFRDVLKDGIYPTTLTKENAIAELLKIYVKNNLSKKANSSVAYSNAKK